MTEVSSTNVSEGKQPSRKWWQFRKPKPYPEIIQGGLMAMEHGDAYFFSGVCGTGRIGLNYQGVNFNIFCGPEAGSLREIKIDGWVLDKGTRGWKALQRAAWDRIVREYEIKRAERDSHLQVAAAALTPPTRT
jgi:hypothetical protein